MLGACEPYIYDSCIIKDVDNFKELTGLATLVKTVFDKETGEVLMMEEEEDVNIKQQLLERISEHVASLGIACVDAGENLVCSVTDGF